MDNDKCVVVVGGWAIDDMAILATGPLYSSCSQTAKMMAHKNVQLAELSPKLCDIRDENYLQEKL